MNSNVVSYMHGLDPDAREGLPRVLPAGWIVMRVLHDGIQCVNNLLNLAVIASVATELDGKRWLHVSASAPDRIPTWKELRLVKDIFIGKNKLAVQVLPPDEDYINLNPHVLHLWHCLDGCPVPDFAQGGKTI